MSSRMHTQAETIFSKAWIHNKTIPLYAESMNFNEVLRYYVLFMVFWISLNWTALDYNASFFLAALHVLLWWSILWTMEECCSPKNSSSVSWNVQVRDGNSECKIIISKKGVISTKCVLSCRAKDWKTRNLHLWFVSHFSLVLFNFPLHSDGSQHLHCRVMYLHRLHFLRLPGMTTDKHFT